MLLGTSVAEIEAELYRFTDTAGDLDDANLVASLTLTSFARNWQDVLSESGSGGLSFQNYDATLANFVDDGDDVVVLKYRGERALALLIENKERVTKARTRVEELTTYTGRGHMAIFERGLVWPAGGEGRLPAEDDRPFNWTSPEFDDDAWVPPSILGTVEEAINLAELLFGTDPSEFSVDPALFINLFWAPGADWLNTIVGDCYFRQTITVPQERRYLVALITDDEGELYIDGQPITSTTGYNALGVTTAEVDLSAGTHVVSGHVSNFDNTVLYPGVFNGGKFGFGVWTINLAGQADVLVAQGQPGEMVMVAYPPEPPGMTVGQVIRLVLEENQARGYLLSIVLNFTDTHDSDGIPWPVTADIATKTGTDLYTFLQELSQTHCDLWMDPGGFTLNAYVIDGRGSDLSADVEITGPTAGPATGNIVTYTETGEYHPIGAFLIRWRNGWAKRENAASIAAYGRREALIEIGAPTSIDEVYRVADRQFAYFADPRTEIGTTQYPIAATDTAYTAFRPGDQLMTPTGVERLLSITMDETDGVGLPTLTFRNIILGAMERTFQQLNKIG